MKKSELLSRIDRKLLEALMGFCYRRTATSHEAQELCSDIVYELCRIGNSEGEIGRGAEDEATLYAYIWQVARHVYADHAERRARVHTRTATGDADTILALLSDEDDTAAEKEAAWANEALRGIYRRIADLTAAYRAVMIAYYLDGKSTRQIAGMMSIPEGTVRQRLFAAREKVRKDMTDMETIKEKPTMLKTLQFFQSGSGDPTTGDPRDLLEREISKQIVWLCRNRALSARQIADELNIPMLYIEDELRMLSRGEGSAQYAALRKIEGGRYTANFILLSKEEFANGQAIVREHFPALCNIIADYMTAHKDAYMAFPYLNHRVEWNSVAWQHVHVLASTYGDMVTGWVDTEHLRDIELTRRPFVVVSHEMRDDGESVDWCGWDGIQAENLCGIRSVRVENLYTKNLQAHFHCAHNLSDDGQLQLAMRAIDGLDVATLNGDEREAAARAIEQGYLYREDDTLYTRILVMDGEGRKCVFEADDDIKEAIRPLSKRAAGRMAAWLREVVPTHLLGDYSLLAHEVCAGIFAALLPALMERGVLSLPEGGLGAEGCWMTVDR